MLGIVAACCLIAAAVLSAIQFATPYEEFEDRMPLEKEFELPMVANSTVEVAVEIDTDIKEGSKVGWNIVGLEWQICANTSPYAPIPISTVGVDAFLQLARGDVPDTPVKLKPSDRDLIFEESYVQEIGDATGVIVEEGSHIHTIRKRGQTQMSKIYFLFGTQADWAAISDAANSIFGKIFYFPVTAPSAPREAW